MSAVRRSAATADTAGWALGLGWLVWWAWRTWPVSGLSWHFFPTGARLLLHHSGLSLYGDHPELQIGPLPLLLTGLLEPLPRATGRSVALLLMTAVGPLLLLALQPLVEGRHPGRRLLLAGLLLAPAWTVLSVRWGHLDDVLAMAFAVLALRAVAERRPVLAGLLLAGAVASKPWAVAFLPLLLALPHRRPRAALAALGGMLVAWGPFLLLGSRTLGALQPPVALARASGLHTLGVRGEIVPAWGRTVQLAGAAVAALLVALTRRWPGVLLVAVLVRLALDPQDNAYYVGSAALAAAVFDLLGTRWTVPWTTLVTVVALWQPFVRDFPHRLQNTTGLTHWWFAHQSAVGALHLVWAVAMLTVVVVVSPLTRSPVKRAS